MSSKIDIHVIGNSIVDEIFEVQRSGSGLDFETKQFLPGSSNTYSTKRTCYGGLGNLLLVLKDTTLGIHISTHIGNDENGRKLLNYFTKNNLKLSNYPIKETSSSLIISEQLYNNVHEKTSFVKWGNTSNFKNFKPIRSTWAHISYLDILYKLDLSKIRKYYDFISADVCLNNPKKSIISSILQKNLKYLDLLFMSTNEVNSYTNLVHKNVNTISYSDYLTKLLEMYKVDTTIILHSPFWVVSCNRLGKSINLDFKSLKKSVSVVGAGDKFAANFISTLLLNKKQKTNLPIGNKNIEDYTYYQECMLTAHKKTLKILEKNEEI